MRGIFVRSSNLLVLFDAENMPIQTYYREVEEFDDTEIVETIEMRALLISILKNRYHLQWIWTF